MHTLKGIKAMCYQSLEKTKDMPSRDNEENLHGKTSIWGLKGWRLSKEFAQRALSFEAPFNLLAFVHSIIKPPGKPALGLLFQFQGNWNWSRSHWCPTAQGWAPSLLCWPLHGLRPVFVNHTLSKQHTSFISSFHVACLCSGRQYCPNGVWRGTDSSECCLASQWYTPDPGEAQS